MAQNPDIWLPLDGYVTKPYKLYIQMPFSDPTLEEFQVIATRFSQVTKIDTLDGKNFAFAHVTTAEAQRKIVLEAQENPIKIRGLQVKIQIAKSSNYHGDSKVGCYNCRKADHIKKDCPELIEGSRGYAEYLETELYFTANALEKYQNEEDKRLVFLDILPYPPVTHVYGYED